MKEVKIEELINYINPFETREKPAIAVATDGNETNGLTIGWVGFGTLWRKKAATVYIHKDRFSKHIFDKAKYFSICFFKDEFKQQIQYFGTVSGRDENKMINCHMTVNTKDAAPFFEESRVVVICKKMGQSDFDANAVDEGVSSWYKESGVHTQYYGEIVKVLVD